MGQAGRQGALRRESTISPQTVKPTNTSSSPRQRTAFSNRSVNIAGEESVDRWRNRLPHAAIGTNAKLINERGEAIHRKTHRRWIRLATSIQQPQHESPPITPTCPPCRNWLGGDRRAISPASSIDGTW